MLNQTYRKQVELLLAVIPEVAKQECFALHGGTAINLFVRNMPRLSVDIDLTYLPIEDRPTTLENIGSALSHIKNNIEAVMPGAEVEHKQEISKLLVTSDGVSIKVEVNRVGRGVLESPQKSSLCSHAQETLDAFCEIAVVSKGQLYGGKICAALDRQHPRDLFDVKYLLDKEGFTEAIKTGFLLSLVSHDRPIHEVIKPNLLDQRQIMVNHFEGMSVEEFTYEEFEHTRDSLIKVISTGLTDDDKAFLLSIKNVDPDWSIYNFEKFPAVRWKLHNLSKLKSANPVKHKEQLALLQDRL